MVYKLAFRQQRSRDNEFIFLTSCPCGLPVKVGSDDCFMCRYFVAIHWRKYEIECAGIIQKEVQMKIQFM